MQKDRYHRHKEINFNWILIRLKGRIICVINAVYREAIESVTTGVKTIFMTGKSMQEQGIFTRIIAMIKKLHIINNRPPEPICAKPFLSKKDRVLEIYLPCPQCHGKRERRGDFRYFFEKRLHNIDDLISGQPIFLDQKHALRYSRFVGANHGVLKAYVADSAIEGSDQELLLKRGYLSKELIHGYYVAWNKTKNYISNPVFDQTLLA